MNETQLLENLKIDLGIKTTAYDSRLGQYIKTAIEEIRREGVTLSAESYADNNLVIQYAEWMWRKRDTGEGMPKMIRKHLNNRIFDVGGESNG